MGSPREALPTHITTDAIAALLPTINISHPSSISILTTSAEYHVIALLSYSGPHVDLILRIAGSHVPQLKTQNEVAVISWLQSNTTIPVPTIVRWDSSTQNALGCEFILQERVEGESLDALWPRLGTTERERVLDDVVRIYRQLAAHEFDRIGSLQPRDGGAGAAIGPLLDERYWENRDVAKYFPSGGETYASLNPLGPYASYVEYSIARVRCSAHAIRAHESLGFMRPHLALIEEFMRVLRESAGEWDRGAKLRLAHRDLHMGNIMYSVSRARIMAILDWEFSVVMPVQQGDLSRAFMWPEPREKVWEMMRKQGHGDLIGEFEFVSEEQEETQEVVDLLRAIVEVSPRGQRAEEKMEWMREAVRIMREFVAEENGRKDEYEEDDSE